MRKIYSLLLLVAVLGGIVNVLLAGPPDRNKGKVLILENEHVLEGNVEKVGKQYLIRRSVGETWVPGERVLAMCQDKEEAYRFLRGRMNLDDADEHLKLAQWCHLNTMPAQALAEVAEAVKLRANHRPSQRLLTHLQQAAAAKAGDRKAPPAEEPEPLPPPPIDLTEEALGQFATRVQPILMNTCAGCHANGKGGAFRLTRTYDATLGNRKVVQYNLAAVLSQVNPAQPQASPLLAKSVSVHGDLTQSPLKNRQAAAYRTLEEWVRKVVGDNPQLRQPLSNSPMATPPPLPTAPAPPARAVPTTAVKPEPARDPEPARSLPPAKNDTKARPEEKPADPFDPAEFNKQVR